MVIAAFLGLSLLLRSDFASALFRGDGLGGWMGLDFCASASGRLILAASSESGSL